MVLRTPYGLVIERDSGLRNDWALALEQRGLSRVLRRTRPSEAAPLIEPDMPVVAMIAGLSAKGAADDSMLRVIARIRARAPRAVILAVDHGDRPLIPAAAFRAGADDVMRTDQHPSEFDSRLTLRLAQAGIASGDRPGLEGLGLTPVESAILKCLSDAHGSVVSRDTLAQVVGEDQWTYGDRRFDVHIARIRKKLEDSYGPAVTVRTIRARGYVLDGALAG